MPSLNQGNFSVEFKFYQASPDSSRAILILPPTGGVTILDRLMASSFKKAGFNVYLISNWSGQDEKSLDLEIHQRLYERGLRAIKMVLDSMTSEFVGILGTSVGATFAAIAMSTFERLDAGFSVVGGVSIPEVLARSDLGVMEKLKADRGYTGREDEYIAAIKKVFTLDPLDLEPIFKGKDLGLVIATSDKTVPFKNQEMLRALWATEQVHYFSNAHVVSIIRSSLFLKKEIIRFFQKSADKKGIP